MSASQLMSHQGVSPLALACFLIVAPWEATYGQSEPDGIDLSGWELVWSDDFDYPDSQLDQEWISQSGPSRHILCSRWRENAVVRDGVLELQNRRENRGGQEWTSASVWTKRQFKYGYFECRYRYAEAPGTNNSFWLMTRGPDPAVGKRFEIDINEGHYPNEVNTNIHNWSDKTRRPDGKTTHPAFSRQHAFGGQPAYSLPMETPFTTTRVRLASSQGKHFHLREFRAFPPAESYPDPLGELPKGSAANTNLATRSDVTVTASGSYKAGRNPELAVDGTHKTSWVSNRNGPKWLELCWEQPVAIGCLQFSNGWRDGDEWMGLLSDFTLLRDDRGEWREAASMDSSLRVDFGADYHTYGLLWTEEELIFYLDGEVIRREANEFCHSESPIYLSEAIIAWGGDVTDEIDGTSMKVDWVRYYQDPDAPLER